MLTKQESKFRTKIIQERHLKKIDQITLDYTVKNCEYLTYKSVYTIGFVEMSFDKLCDGINEAYKAAKKMLDALITFWPIWQKIMNGWWTKMNCKNCGAPIYGSKCEYCGSCNANNALAPRKNGG